SQNYIYNDPQDGFGKNKLYRIRQVMNTGMGVYSNVLKISFNNKINLVSRPRPNPFISSLDLNVQLKADNVITLRMRDESGRMVFYQRYTGHRGENKLNVTGMTHLRPGIFILEVAVDDEVIREKMVKN
ncbi:MAG: T9SS type A sorting domain-containing protein, partial [Chitinophagaceae bacterium]|nr:T9SS type A sorting domain-containing protein [Chitinophagaceae bacterium]